VDHRGSWVTVAVDKQWPPGRPLIAQSFVERHKRERCALAIAEVVHRDGPGGTTIDKLVRESRIARNTFYELFGSRECALGFACSAAGQWLAQPVVDATATRAPRTDRVKAGLAGLLAAVIQRPSQAELYLLYRWHFMPANEDRGPLEDALASLLASAAADEQQRIGRAEFSAECLVAALAGRLRRREMPISEALAGDLIDLALATSQESSSGRSAEATGR
jgi:AcrR family transcriptional regulator